jgi:hypothetical protein
MAFVSDEEKRFITVAAGANVMKFFLLQMKRPDKLDCLSLASFSTWAKRGNTREVASNNRIGWKGYPWTNTNFAKSSVTKKNYVS